MNKLFSLFVDKKMWVKPIYARTLLLLLLLPAGAFAASEAGQEIGIPTPIESKVKSCFDVHLSPNSDRFYTLRDGLLTQYQIHPFKKLGATRGDWSTVKEPGCYMRITDDEKKLLVVDKNRIYAFDMGTGRLLNKAEWEYRSSPAVIVNGDELVILQSRTSGDHQSTDFRVWVELEIWDINTLKLKQKITEFGKDFGFIADTGGWPAMSKIQDRIYLKSDQSLVVLNSKTYKPELSLNTGLAGSYGGKPNRKPLSSRELPLLSKDFRTLYVPRIAKVTDYLTGTKTTFDEIGRDKAFVFDLKTREFRIDSLENLSRDAFDPWLFTTGHLSRNKNYLMSGRGSHHAHAVLLSISPPALSFFYQYGGGEAIVVEYRDNQPAAFQLTPDARKYLMMDKAAKIPINDATFNKYRRP